jgi:Uma2 family endonuclease
MATTAKPLTYREWLEMPGSPDCIEEVVNGEIRKMPPNKLPHPDVVHELTIAFARLLPKKKVAIYGSNFGLVIRKEPLTCRIPDLALFQREGLDIEDGYIHSPAQLVVEVLSPAETRRDVEEKLRDYESLGVPEVWVVSPEARTVQVLRLTEGTLKTDRILVEGTVSPLKFPEAVIDVTSIWPD